MSNVPDISGIVFNIQKFSINDGPGIRTTVFLKGCPLNCAWCQNPESKNPLPEPQPVNFRKGYSGISHENEDIIGYKAGINAIMTELMKDYIFYENSGGGVTFSGGEPLLQIDFLEELLKSCKLQDIHTTVDTSGYAPQSSFERILDITDLFLFDLKIIDDESHLKYTGVSNSLILDNLKYLCERNKNVFLRIPLIPGITDTEENLTGIADYISRIKSINTVSLLPYNELCESKYKKLNLDYILGKLEVQTEEKLNKFSNIFKTYGFDVKIRG